MKATNRRQAFSAVGVVVVCSAAVFGQTGTSQGSRTRPDPVQRELQRRFESEAIEQALAERPRLRADDERRLVLTQIRDDFLQLQILDDQLQRAASQSQSPDLKTISKSAAAITKRAQRLKENLRLPKMEGVGDRVWGAGEDGKLGLSMSELSNAIKMFVENPVFERLGVVDAKLSANAGRDLEQIILVSKQVRRISEKLK